MIANKTRLSLAVGMVLSQGLVMAQFEPVVKLSSLTGNNGFEIQGASSDFSGNSVSNAGDINGDGIDDIIIGAIYASPNGFDSGTSYVVYGQLNRENTPFNLTDINGVNGFEIQGEKAGDHLGSSVNNAGDINGDGIDDVIIGALSAGSGPGSPSVGASYVVYGKLGGVSHPLSLADIDGSNGFMLQGVSDEQLSGRSVSNAGDINGDGVDDVIIGTASESSYVVFGQTDLMEHPFNLGNINGINGFEVKRDSITGDLGHSVSNAGDFNGDGVDDFIVGAPIAVHNGNQSGISYVIFGKTEVFGNSFNLTNLNGINGFEIQGVSAGDFSGGTVSNAGDINDDGFDDVIVGAHRAGPNGDDSGSSYVIYGRSGGISNPFSLVDINGLNGFEIQGASEGDGLGIFVSNANDINGDGVDDLIVGAFTANRNGANSGTSYVVFGKSGGVNHPLDLGDINGSNGFEIQGVSAGDFSGTSVSNAGDINGDGFNDVIIGAWMASPNDEYSGSSYVVYGKEKALFKNGFEVDVEF